MASPGEVSPRTPQLGQAFPVEDEIQLLHFCLSLDKQDGLEATVGGQIQRPRDLLQLPTATVTSGLLWVVPLFPPDGAGGAPGIPRNQQKSTHT